MYAGSVNSGYYGVVTGRNYVEGGWWNESDISLKVARLLRVLRLRYARPGSISWTLAQWINRVADAWREAERARVLDAEDRAAEPPPLKQMLGLADPYQVWRERVEPEIDRVAEVGAVTHGPLISVVLPVYKVPTRLLRATLTSLRAQTYQDWEACIAFADPDRQGGVGGANLKLLQRLARKDARIRLAVLDNNYGISGNSNAALEMTRGDYIALLDHDDELPPLALSRMVAAIRAEPRADFLYSDKENLTQAGDRRCQPLFKPEWSPEMLYSVNYLTHFNQIGAELDIEHRLTKSKHPWTNGQVERMNRTIKDATVKRYHYDNHHQLRRHLADFVAAYNFRRRQKTLKGLTPYEAICRAWTKEPGRFTSDPTHQSLRPNA